MKKILLIEDDTVMRENTAEMIELACYQVFTAKHGKEGVDLAMKHRPDLIICDIMMPQLDGYGVLELLSKEPSTACIPFIFLTAKAEKSEVRKGMELGADDYLTKPFEEAELLNAIETRLKKHERIKKDFAFTIEGLNHFLQEAKGFTTLKLLSQQYSSSVYRKKEGIFYEGDHPQSLFFLNKGRVKTYKMHDDGKEYGTNLYHDGEFFGYVPLLENSFYSDSAVALEDCEICKIPKEDFLSLVYKNRDVASQFIKMLSNRVTEREKQLLSLAYDTVRKRVAEALLFLEKCYREEGEKNVKINLSRDDLASLAGTATETVIRSLSELKTEGLIEIKGRNVVILNLEALQQIR